MDEFIRLSELSEKALFEFYIKFVAATEKASFRDPWDESALCELLQLPNYDALILSEKGEAVGYCAFGSVIDEAEILRLAVVPEKRRSGAGDRLLKGFIGICEKSSVAEVFLEVRKGNGAARGLYEKNGFVEFAERKGYYENGEDAVMYKKILKRIGETT